MGLDAKKGFISTEAWTESSEIRAEDLIKEYSSLPINSIIYTDISKDGLLSGPNIKKINYFQDIIEVPLVASGGVSSLDDLLNLKKSNVFGTIVGKAIYDKKVVVKKIFHLVS